MANGVRGAVAREMRALWLGGSAVGMTDGQLIDRFVEGRDDEAERAFAVLVARHGPLVFRVALDVLHDRHAAEDVFQATFLVLARKAGSLARPETLGPWLYGVAHRVALKARVEARRRGRRERLGAGRESAVEETRGEDHETLHDELARLSKPCRDSIVLCYFEGLTYNQAAHRLGVSEATVRGRLERTRRLLRSRLVDRELASWPLPIVPGRWIGPTARAASRFAGGLTEGIPARVAGLAEGASRIMVLSKFKAAAVLVALPLVAASAWLAPSRPAGGGESPARPRVEKAGSTVIVEDAPAPKPSGLALNYDQAVDRLVRESADLKARLSEIPSAKADVLTASLRTNPVLYADSQLIPYGSYVRTRPGGQTQLDVNVTYLYDLNRKRKARAAASVRATEIIEAHYVDAVRQKIDSLGHAFVRVLADQELVAIARKSVGRLELLGATARERGVSAQNLARIELEMTKAGVGIRLAEAELKRSLRAVSALLEIPPDVPLKLEPGKNGWLPTATFSAEELVGEAEEFRPDLTALRLGVVRTRAELDSIPAKPTEEAGRGLADQVRGDQERARLNLAAVEVELDQLKHRIADEVKEACREFGRFSQDSIERKEREVVATRNDSDMALVLFGRGEADLLDALLAGREAVDAAQTEVEHRFGRADAAVSLNTAVGRRVVQP